MKNVLIFLIIFTIYGCGKQKTVLICGDHVCINKKEAKQYFEENLTLEVRIIDKKKPDVQDLVQLNLKSNSQGKKEISVKEKKNVKKDLKILTNNEIKEVKKKLKNIKKTKSKKLKKKKTKQVKLNKTQNRKKIEKNILKNEKIVNKTSREVADICTILEKCSIDEISKYLIKQGKEKKFPDIRIKE